jgi:hypothetical protein
VYSIFYNSSCLVHQDVSRSKAHNELLKACDPTIVILANLISIESLEYVLLFLIICTNIHMLFTMCRGTAVPLWTFTCPPLSIQFTWSALFLLPFLASVDDEITSIFQFDHQSQRNYQDFRCSTLTPDTSSKIKINLHRTHLLVCKSCKWQEDEFLNRMSPEEGCIYGEQSHGQVSHQIK